MYFALKGKRSQLDTSDRKGTYRYAGHRYKPVWEKLRRQTNDVGAVKGKGHCEPLNLTHDIPATHEGRSEAEEALVTAFNSGFPPEVPPMSVVNTTCV
jgi:hypothetical protein